MARLIDWVVLLSSFAIGTAMAHYQFTALMIEGGTTGDWTYVRKTNEYERVTTSGYGNPVKDVKSLDLRCNNTLIESPSGTITIAAGEQLGFWSTVPAYHPGVFNVYMAQAPANVSEWDGSGEVWFRVHEIPPIIVKGDRSWINFPGQHQHVIEFTIPKALPDGEYLVRIENIALHMALTEGAEFYVSCGQIKVTNGGTGTPHPLVSIPGVYTGEEPGLHIDVYSTDPPPYIMPGPPLWSE